MSLLARAWRHRATRAGTALLVTMTVIAVAGPFLLPDPRAIPDGFAGAIVAPGSAHLFGTDQLGRDVLSRVATGGRVSLAVALLAVGLSLTIGLAVGLVAGALGGAVEIVAMRAVDAALAIPRLFILLLVLTVSDRIALPVLILMIGATGWLGMSRLARAEVVRLRQEPFALAATALGASRRRVILRHFLPNALGPVLVSAARGGGALGRRHAGRTGVGGGGEPPTPPGACADRVLE